MAAPVAPGLQSALKGAYNEFTEADGLLAQKRADIAAREQLLTEKTIALQQRKADAHKPAQHHTISHYRHTYRTPYNRGTVPLCG